MNNSPPPPMKNEHVSPFSTPLTPPKGHPRIVGAIPCGRPVPHHVHLMRKRTNLSLTNGDQQLDRGVLRIFRLYIVVQWLLLTLLLLLSKHHPALNPSGMFNFSWALTTFLCIYLFWGHLQRILGRKYLPIALLIASIGPEISQMIATGWWLRHGRLPEDIAQALIDPNTLYGSLLLPLLMVSTQYGLSILFCFTIGTTILSLLQLFLLSRFDHTLIALLLPHLISRLILFSIAGAIIVLLSKVLRQQKQALAQKNAQLTYYATTLEQLAISRERNRIARDLHDTLSHTLSALNIQLKALDILCVSDPQQGRQTIKQMQALTHDGLQETRRVLSALRASPLEEYGLAVALQRLAQTVATRTGLQLTVDIVEPLMPIPLDVEQQFYRIAEEALYNVERHANATTLSVALQPLQTGLVLTIVDNGRGFDISTASTYDHYGLTGMRERATFIEARLDICSAVAKGTTIRLYKELEREWL